ncbi:MAG: fluoride efflux transporter CrcB [Thermoleophilia bacterium]
MPARLLLPLSIGAGGALGTWLRLGLADRLPVEPGHWPWPTLIANVVACLLLGYAATRLLERLPPSTYRRPLVGTGICGGLSTFSTLQVEAIEISRDGHAAMAVGYVATSILLGLAAVALASAAVRRARVRLP